MRDLSLQVPLGEVFGLLGPNGAGKTTAIQLLLGWLRPDAGAARILGLDCARERARTMAHVGYVPDEPTFYDHLRASELLRYCGTMHGLSAAETASRSTALAETFGLADALDDFAVNLSKGTRKKLALACALLHRPQVLILDEPTNGLDPVASRALQGTIQSQAAAGAAVFLTTHLLDQAERLCHRVGIMVGGQLVAEGAVHDLRRPEVGRESLEHIFFRVVGGGS